ncbi:MULTISPECIES: Gfo/Idh/MocA family protein [Bacillaceae]|uniref:Gfo/Idh/MocA family oxidoreductase n=1 Tax=Evansella alkalicola TaxID=745819 RepID=A0ABS6JWV0_9BACI|nr:MULTISPECIES: Gfo/Idh/MocA family oxidoreductase [Bacillaceae]MBU9721707.1 Gfo/Idh/MocA family oxidoreductase [Bacillus alkalicola]
MARYRVLLAGCGSMANTWVDYALKHSDIDIVGLVDINEANAKAFSNEHQLKVPIFREVKEGASATEANVVFDTTIPDAHKEIAISSFEAGCDLMAEKPMASSIEDARQLVAAAEASNRFYAVMQNRRYINQIRALRRVIRDDVIGKTSFVSADFFMAPHFGGFRDAMESPLILDMAIHTFDQARFIIGADPVSVYCHEFNPEGSWYKGNAAAICIFEMSDGSVFNYRGSWCAEGVPTSWESTWRVNGTKGTAIWDGVHSPFYETVKPTSEKVFLNEFTREQIEVPEKIREGHFGCLDEMFTALSEGRQAETDCRDNIKSMEMVFGALESAAKGEKILLG